MKPNSFEKLIKHILKGDQNSAVTEAKLLKNDGVSPEDVIINAIEIAMEKLDAKCTIEQFNLLEIMLSGRAVSAVMHEFYPEGEPIRSGKGKVILGALEGDVHDIGKNILKMVLQARGIEVVDCGKDCPIDKLIKVAKEENPTVIGVSGLISTIIPQVRKLKDIMDDEGLSHIKLIAGGAALKQLNAETLNVDFLAQNTFDGAKYIESLVS